MTALAEKGFKSRRSIIKLTPDIIKKEFKALVIAQQLLLLDGVTGLQSAATQHVSDQQTQAGDHGGPTGPTPTGAPVPHEIIDSQSLRICVKSPTRIVIRIY